MNFLKALKKVYNNEDNLVMKIKGRDNYLYMSLDVLYHRNRKLFSLDEGCYNRKSDRDLMCFIKNIYVKKDLDALSRKWVVLTKEQVGFYQDQDIIKIQDTIDNNRMEMEKKFTLFSDSVKKPTPKKKARSKK